MEASLVAAVDVLLTGWLHDSTLSSSCIQKASAQAVSLQYLGAVIRFAHFHAQM